MKTCEKNQNRSLETHKCNSCDNAYGQSGDLNKHIRKVHKEEEKKE